MTDNTIPVSLAPIVRLTKDAVAALREGEQTATMAAGTAPRSGAAESRILIDLYYGMQEMRKRLSNQIGAIKRGADSGTSHACADFILQQAETLERNAEQFLCVFAAAHPLWPWFSAVHGIGPVLTAGLIAHLGTRPAPPTVGHWWRYAGLDPSQQWQGKDQITAQWESLDGDPQTRATILAGRIGRDIDTVLRDATTDIKTGEIKRLTKAGAIKSLARIPYNRPLKTLCWKVGDQFVKLGARQDAFYAKYYRRRKAQEIARNDAGERAALAAKTLAKTPNHAQRAIYAEGKLPDGRVDLMARRATVKLFLSHLHELWYRAENNGAEPPAPYATSIKGHAHYIPPPYLDAITTSKAA